jgi:hypothetical protein
MPLDLDLLLTLIVLIVAVPAAIGGALIGDRVVGWVLSLR